MTEGRDTRNSVKRHGNPGQHDTKQLIQALDKFVENQKAEYSLRQDEIALEEKRIESNERIAMKSIEEQGKFQSHRLTKDSSRSLQKYCFWGFMALLFAAFVVTTIVLDAKSMVNDLLKTIVPLIASAVGAYFWGKSRRLEGSHSNAPVESIDDE